MWNYKKKAQYIKVTHTYTRGAKAGQTITIKRRVLKRKNPRQLIEKKLTEIVRVITRKRDHDTCVKCGNTCYGSYSNPSHFFNAVKKSTRWNLLNVDTICLGCHRKIEYKKDRIVDGWCYEDFKIEQLGQEQFDILTALANSPGHYTLDQLQELYIQLQKELVCQKM